MKNEKFGSVVKDGKVINLDRTSFTDLEKMAEDLKAKEIDLKQKVFTVFKQ